MFHSHPPDPSLKPSLTMTLASNKLTKYVLGLRIAGWIDREIKLLIDGRFEDLEAEMRRITDPTRPAVDSYYFKDKVIGHPHVSDAPLATFESFVKRGDITMGADDVAHVKRMREKGGPGLAPKSAKRKSYTTRSKQGAKRYKLRKLK
jgi:hypothetical protein